MKVKWTALENNPENIMKLGSIIDDTKPLKVKKSYSGDVQAYLEISERNLAGGIYPIPSAVILREDKKLVTVPLTDLEVE